MENKKSNTCGIIGVCTGWIIPLVGIILGIIALARREKTIALGIISIVEGAVFWMFWFYIKLATYSIFL